jgi:hypothetical protein
LLRRQAASVGARLWPEVHRPVETLEELRALQRDLVELGDAVAVALLERAERCFLAWEMDKGERFWNKRSAASRSR